MLTLHKNENTVQICELVDKKTKIPVYWHPTFKEELLNDVEDLTGFNDDYFRDRFELSKEQADSIFAGLKTDSVDETQQSKYFKVKRHVKDSLITEMSLDGDQYFEIGFEKNNDYSGHMLFCGGTASGKSFAASRMCLKNLQGPKRYRRQFLIFSAEWDTDKTMKPLKDNKFGKYVTGIDVGEDALKNSEHENAEQFFKNEVELRCEYAEGGTVILFDDPVDSCCPNMIRKLINRGLRVYRHKQLTLLIVLHNIRSGAWSSQAYNSVRYLVLFPQNQKNNTIILAISSGF